jgi:MoxR-like ATPase
MSAAPASASAILRAPAEQIHAEELATLAERDAGPKPEGWRLSPRAVRSFIVGDDRLGVRRKFFGDDALIDRCIVTLMSSRGLLLVGEPGTAKSMLSELLAALLLAEGPSPRALVRGPLYTAMQRGQVCRFEEITRVQPEIQDCLIGLLSDKALHVPELDGEDGIVYAARGFNVLATANLRDRGVHEMSSALKRRFNFETVRPISDRKLETQLVRDQTEALFRHAEVEVEFGADAVELLVTAFHDLRNGVTAEGVVVEKPTAVMSSAEAVAVGYAAGLDAHYFGDGEVGGEHIARQLIGTVLKDNPDDGKKLRHYFDVVVKQRAQRHGQWKRVLDARRELER